MVDNAKAGDGEGRREPRQRPRPGFRGDRRSWRGRHHHSFSGQKKVLSKVSSDLDLYQCRLFQLQLGYHVVAMGGLNEKEDEYIKLVQTGWIVIFHSSIHVRTLGAKEIVPREGFQGEPRYIC